MKASLIVFLLVISNFSYIRVQGQENTLSTKQLIEKSRKFQRALPDSAIYYGRLAINRAKIENDDWAQGRVHAILGRTRELQGENIEGLLHYFDALELLESTDTTDFYTSYSVSRNIAAIHNDFGLHDTSIKFYDSARHYLKLHVKHFPKIARQYNDHLKLYDLAYFKYLNQSRIGKVEEATQGFLSLVDDKVTPAKVKLNSHNRIAIILSQLGDETAALKSFQSIINHPEVDSLTTSHALQNIGAEYLKHGKTDRAKSYLTRAIVIKKALGNDESLFVSYLDLGEAYLKMENLDQANIYLQRAIDLNINIKDNPERFVVYQFLGLSLLETNTVLAKTYLNKFTALSHEHRKVGAKMELETKKREVIARIDQHYLKKQNDKVLNEKNQFHSRQLAIVTLLIFTSFSITIWLMKRVDKNKRKAFFQDLKNTGVD